jgi:hypothetical protein
MKELDFESDAFDLEYDEFKEDNDKPTSRYRVTVELIIRADNADDASDDAKLLIDSGIVALMDKIENR